MNLCSTVAALALLRQLGLEPRRVLRVGARELGDLAVERRREEHRLALARHAPEDLLDLRLEAHVEHPVGLVEDEDADAVEREHAAVEEILEPAGCRDEDVGAARALRLGAERRAAVDRRDAKPLRRGECRDLGGDLKGELARRHEDERRRRVARLRPLDDRNRERERLARARRRLREDVAAFERVSEDERLDLERTGDVLRGERLLDLGTHAERAERLLRQIRTPSVLANSRPNDSKPPKEEREANLPRRRDAVSAQQRSSQPGRRRPPSGSVGVGAKGAKKPPSTTRSNRGKGSR